MVHLARFAGLPWDCIITAENARCYKPRPEVYRTAAELLGLRPGRGHDGRRPQLRPRAPPAPAGFRTAFVPRPAEHGPGQTSDLAPEADWDVVAADFLDLARQLGA